MKRYLSLLGCRKIQIKTFMRYNFTSTRLAKKKRNPTMPNVGKDGDQPDAFY